MDSRAHEPTPIGTNSDSVNSGSGPINGFLSGIAMAAGFAQRSSTGTTVVSLISSMTKEADTSDSGTLAISRW